MIEPIKYEDIRKGDTIYAAASVHGIALERTGIVGSKGVGRKILYSAHQRPGLIWDEGWEGQWTFSLIERPEPEPLVLQSVYHEHFSVTVKHDDDTVTLKFKTPTRLDGAEITVARAELLEAIK